MAICLPGMASKVKRAATSAMRPEPLVITTKLISTMIRKMMMPTAKLPPTTKLPKDWITCPTAPWPSWPWSRMSRVEAIFSASLNRVVISSSEGKEEKSSGLVLYMLISRMSMPMVMLKESSMSSRKGGSGTIMTRRMATTPSATKRPDISKLIAFSPVAAPGLSAMVVRTRSGKG